MKTILILNTMMTLAFGATVHAAADPLGTYAITIKGTYFGNDGTDPVRAKGTLKLKSVTGVISIRNISGSRGGAYLRMSKAISMTATSQTIKGTVKDPSNGEKGTFTGKLVRSGSHYKLTADMRVTDSEGVMKGTLTGTK